VSSGVRKIGKKPAMESRCICFYHCFTTGSGFSFCFLGNRYWASENKVRVLRY